MTLDHRRVAWAFPEAQPGTCRGCGRACDPGSRAHPACRDRQREMANHRKAMLERHGGHPVCVDRRRGLGRCEGKIESDHVEELVDGGDKAWTVPRCKRHHEMKTQRQAAARRSRRGATMSQTDPTQRTNPWVIAAGVFLAVEGALLVLGRTGWAIALPCIAVAVLVAGAFGAHALSRRKDARERLAIAIAREMRVDPGQVHVQTRGRAGSARYPVTAADVPGSPWCRAIQDVIAAKVGGSLAFTWFPSSDVVQWRPRRDDEPVTDGATLETNSDPGGVQSRVHEALTSVIKGESSLTVVGQPDAVGPLAMRLTYPASLRDDSDDVRASIVSIVNHKAPGRWRATWDTEANRALFERRPPMPKVIVHAPADDLSDQDRLPFATGEDHEWITWDLKTAPHALVAGETGSGKTVLIRTLVSEAAARGFEVMICDPKRIEMRGFAQWPNVTAVATSTLDMVALVDLAYRIMDERYIAIEEDPAAKAGMHPIMLVVDEAREWIDRVNASFRADQARIGGEHPTIERWRSIARLGRGARVHLLVGIQRPDAKVFGGEARDNYGARIALGSLSEQGARMMFGAADVGRDVPDTAKGRATIDVGGGVHEVQSWWTPDPRDHDPDDEAVLDALRPPSGSRYPARVLDPGRRGTKPEPKARAGAGWRMRPAESLDHGQHVRRDGVEADVIENLDDPTDENVVRVTVTLADGTEDEWPLDRTDGVEVAAV